MDPSRVTLGDGCTIAFRLDGPEGAPVLMLSNSLGTNLALWDAQVAPFAARHRLLRYDSRGHGRSDAPPGAYSTDRLGRDAVELLDALGLDRVHFCGLSQGGMVGQWLAVRHPERLGRLVLADTAAYMGPPAAWQQRIDTALREGMAPIADAALARWFTPGFRAAQPATVARLREMLLTTPPHGYAGCCAAIRDMDLRPTASRIACPTLLVTGRHDPSTPPERAEELARAIPGARILVLEAAHLSNVEQPEAFASGVLQFLSGAGLPAASRP